MVQTRHGVGQVTVGQGNLLLLPKRWAGDGTVPGVIYCHGATQTETQLIDRTNYPNLSALLFAVADAGYPVLACGFGGDAFGNDTSLTQTGTAKTYLQGANVGAKAGPVVMVAASMGGAQAMNYAKANPSSVSCLVLMEPASDLEDIRANNRAGQAAALNTAYGGTYNNATDGLAHNPAVYVGSMTGVRRQVWYATDDTSVIPSTVLTAHPRSDSAVELHTISGNHTDTAFASISATAIRDFITAHA